MNKATVQVNSIREVNISGKSISAVLESIDALLKRIDDKIKRNSRTRRGQL